VEHKEKKNFFGKWTGPWSARITSLSGLAAGDHDLHRRMSEDLETVGLHLDITGVAVAEDSAGLLLKTPSRK